MNSLSKILTVSTVVLLASCHSAMAFETSYSNNRVVKVKRCYYNYSHTIRYCYYKSVYVPTKKRVVKDRSFEQYTSSYYQFERKEAEPLSIRRNESFYYNEPSFFESF